jgi:hypothetical protein
MIQHRLITLLVGFSLYSRTRCREIPVIPAILGLVVAVIAFLTDLTNKIVTPHQTRDETLILRSELTRMFESQRDDLSQMTKTGVALRQRATTTSNATIFKAA